MVSNLNTKLAKIWTNKGRDEYKSGRNKEAIKCFDKAISLDEKYVDAYNNKAWLLARTQWREEAIEIIEKSLLIEPDNAQTLDIKGYILDTLGKKDLALESLDKSIGKNPNDKYSYYHKGNVQLQLTNYDDAELCYDKSIGIDEEFAEAHNGKAIVLFYKKDYSSAKKQLRKAISINPSLSIAHENLIKLTMHGDNRNLNFWDFWASSTSKKIVAIFLTIFALGVIIYYPLVTGPQIEEKNERIENGTQVILKNTTTTTKIMSHEIPNSHLVISGLAILILLSPIIKSFKAGGVEVELITVEAVGIMEPTLALTDEPIRQY